MSNKIHVIGAGVIGLTTAITLQKAGYSVHITTEKLPLQTTSAKAAAIWLPYKIEPLEQVTKWSKVSYQQFSKLAKDKQTGVSFINFMVLLKEEAITVWKDALPKTAYRKATAKEQPSGDHLAYILHIPLIETPIYLDYLSLQFQQNGGTLTQKKINHIEGINDSKSIIINCTGLGASELLNDKLMYPIRGQIVKIAPQKGILGLVEDYPTGANLNELAYIIPRSDCIIIGGTAEEGATDLTPKKETSQGIINRCKTLCPELDTSLVQSEIVGLRPGRKEVRLEWGEGTNIIHNYGHGGSGYTVSWGCADEVLELLSRGTMSRGA